MGFRKSVLLMVFAVPFLSHAFSFESAIKLWQEAYNQGYSDGMEKCQGVRKVVVPGYYIAVSDRVPRYVAGLLKFLSKKYFFDNYFGGKKDNYLLLLHASTYTEAKYLKEQFDKKAKKVLDMFNIDTTILEIRN